MRHMRFVCGDRSVWQWLALGSVWLQVAASSAGSAKSVGERVDGWAIDGAMLDKLPHGRHLVAQLDLLLAPVVSLQPTVGGLEMFDNPRVSLHGWPAAQLRWRLDGLDVTDVLRPGQPLFEAPFATWSKVQLASLWRTGPAVDTSLAAPRCSRRVPQGRARFVWGNPAGDDFALPTGWFDRDPAYAYGAPRARRALQRAYVVDGSGCLPLGRGDTRLDVEVVRQAHRYITLVPLEDAQRQTLLLQTRLRAALFWDLLVGWQRQARSFDGAWARLPQALTAATQSQAAILQLATSGQPQPELRLRAAMGLTMRQDWQRPHALTAIDVPVQDQWQWLLRPPLFADSRSVQAHFTATATHRGTAALHLQTHHGAWQQLPHLVENRRTESVEGRLARSIEYAPPTTTAAGRHHLRGDLVFTPRWKAGHLDTYVGLDTTVLHFGGGARARTLGFASPAAGVAGAWPLGGERGEVFALLRHEPYQLQAPVAHFLDGDGLHGVVKRSGDGLVMGRTGALYHDRAADLRRPISNMFALGYNSAKKGPWQLRLQAIGRSLWNRFDVRLASNDGQTQRIVYDPGGDGRGETPLPGGGQALQVVARDPTVAANERFVLGNDAHRATYWGFEFELNAAPETWWFVAIGGAAYASGGGAPPGSFADRNDPGALDESSAEPNAAVHRLGRYDHDRAFALKIRAGAELWSGLHASVAARYRDGQPFTRTLLVPDLPQGPIVVAAVDRGELRHTFAMTWNVRLSYLIKTLPLVWRLSCDITNIFGSATEIVEDARTGPSFRRALEAVPGRAVLIGLELGGPPQEPLAASAID